MTLDPHLERAWRTWLSGSMSAHFDYVVENDDLDRHMAESVAGATDTVARLVSYLDGREPRRILDIGCSTGFKAVALRRRFPRATVHAIDLDDDALALARLLDPAVEFQRAPAEHLPFADASFDLVVCLTTIEHVADVGAVIGELARVLAPGGMAILEAPNYLWPVEPHLGILMPPLAPKPLLRLCATLQGKGRGRSFVDDLQLVHPFWLERLFRAHGLAWDNLAADKLRDALAGERGAIVAYRRLGALATWLGRLGVGAAAARLLTGLGLYPSLMYRLKRA